MKADYIDKDKLYESLKDVEGLIKENAELKRERDNALMSLLLLFINQKEDIIFMPQFDTDIISEVIDYFKLHVQPGLGHYKGDKPQSMYYVAIKDGTPNGYFIKRTPEEIRIKLNSMLSKYIYGHPEEYTMQLEKTDNGVELLEFRL